MSNFDSLALAFEDWFDKPLSDLPGALRERVEREFAPMPWDSLSADQRRIVALQLDYQHDPATEQDRQFWWDFFARKRALEDRITKWESVGASTVGELTKKEDQLAELRREFVRMEQYAKQAHSDYFPEPKQLEASSASRASPYIPYPKAVKTLVERLSATPEEIAAWVWMGPKDGGLAAYRNANELNPPPRFFYYPGNANEFDYVAPLMGCWFRKDDIAQFEPVDRYITGKTLIERWSKQSGIQPEAFIRAKIAESRLLDGHPLFGGTQGTYPEEASFPPLASGLFVRAQVEEIEAEDFGVNDASQSKSINTLPPEIGQSGRLNHDLGMQARANKIAAEQLATTNRSMTRNKVAKILAKELGMDEATVLRRIRKQWK